MINGAVDLSAIFSLLISTVLYTEQLLLYDNITVGKGYLDIVVLIVQQSLQSYLAIISPCLHLVFHLCWSYIIIIIKVIVSVIISNSNMLKSR